MLENGIQNLTDIKLFNTMFYQLAFCMCKNNRVILNNSSLVLFLSNILYYSIIS